MRTKLRSKFTLFFIVCAALLAFAGTAMAITADGSGTTSLSPTIQSDQADYPPGATVTLTGSNWQPGESVHINVNDDQGKTWNYDSNPDVTADANGNISHSFNLPDWFVATYKVTATGAQSGTATTTFTDGNLASVSGKVTDSVTGSGIAGATVTCDTSTGCNGIYTATTNSTGDYVFSSATSNQIQFAGSSATLSLKVTAAGYANGTISLGNVSNGDNLTGKNAALTPTTKKLTVTKTGAGTGTVTSSPTGINCGSTCSFNFNNNTNVTLTATAGANSTFNGWSGDGTGTTTRTVTMDADKSVTATFKANQAALNYTGPTSGTYGDKLTLSSSGGSGTGAVTYNVGSSTACQLGTGADAGKLLITSGTGSCTVTVNKAGDDDYNAASSGPQTITVNKATLNVNADNNSKTYGASNPTNLTWSYSGFVNGDTSAAGLTGSASCSIAASAGPNAGTYTDAITCAPGTLSSTNYKFVTGDKGTLTIDQATPVVHITWSNSTYNGSPNNATATVTGVSNANLGNADSLTYYSGSTASGTALSGAPTNAGTYTVKATYNATTNYKSAFATATITIAQATPSITWSNPAAVDAGTVLGSTQLNAVVNGVDNNVLAGTSVYTPAAGTVLNAGTQTLKVDFTPSAANAVNYKPTSMTVQITVSPYNFGTGFFQPVDNRILNGVKGGSTVPMKFEVFQTLSGTELKSTAAIKTWSTTKVNCSNAAATGVDAIEEYTTGNTSLRFDTTGDQFILNWQAPKASPSAPVGTCYQVTIVASDGSSPNNVLTALYTIR